VNDQRFQPTLRQPSLKETTTRCLAIAGVVAGLAASVLPSPVMALPLFPEGSFPNHNPEPSPHEYRQCTTRLLGVKLSEEEALAACAKAFQPRDLSKCVVNLNKEGGITAIAALDACRQVRRPLAVADCVSGIRNKAKTAATADVLDYCRRSPLPDRFANCVRGLSQAVKVTPTKMMDSCLGTGDLPQQLDPTFIPYTSDAAIVQPTPSTPDSTPQAAPSRTLPDFQPSTAPAVPALF